MKLGILSATFRNSKFEEFLDFAQELGLDSIEYGGYSFADHYTLEELVREKSKRKEFLKLIEDRGLFISALNAPAMNPLHPDSETASRDRSALRMVVELAGMLGVERVVTMSGLPGASPRSVEPVWIPIYMRRLSPQLEWQWRERVIPFWAEEAEYAKRCGVQKICIELHAYYFVYNPATFLQLREAVGPQIGVNLDPSHLFWQGISIVEAIKTLGSSIYHTHMKDIRIDPVACARNGIFDTHRFTDVGNRTWIPCLLGYGHNTTEWKSIVSGLRAVGYDYVLSIEHEDVLFPIMEGAKKAARFLKEIMVEGPPEEMWF